MVIFCYLFDIINEPIVDIHIYVFSCGMRKCQFHLLTGSVFHSKSGLHCKNSIYLQIHKFVKFKGSVFSILCKHRPINHGRENNPKCIYSWFASNSITLNGIVESDFEQFRFIGENDMLRIMNETNWIRNGDFRWCKTIDSAIGKLL